MRPAKAQANIAGAGPDIIRYYKADAGARTGEPDLFLMEAGVPVKPGTRPAVEARVKTLPPYHCAGLLLWGSIAHIVQAYGMLTKAIPLEGFFGKRQVIPYIANKVFLSINYRIYPNCYATK